MINSISSNSSYWYTQTKNGTVNQLLAAATATKSESTVLDVSSAESSDSESANLSFEDIMEMMKNSKSLSSIPTKEDGASEEGDISDIDADGDGTISADEYETMIAQMGINDAASATEFFAQYDTNDDGEITQAEMDAKSINLMLPPMGPPPEEEQGLPSDIDTDGDESLSSDEYDAMISQFGVEDASSAEEFFNRFDTNEDGEISADEMVAMEESVTQSLTAELEKLATNTLRAYETNYQYMFDEELNNLNRIA